MAQKHFIFVLLIIYINLIHSIEESCQKIQCSTNLPKDTCIKVSNDISSFQECPTGQICDIDFDDPIYDAKCIESKKNNFKRLPTLPCEQNDECLSGVCEKNQCKGQLDGETCTKTSDCVYGYTCRKDSNDTYRCLEPITTGNKCEKDSDCVHNSGCMNNICTEYFSLDNEQKGGDLNNEYLSFCKSGYSDFLGFCQNLTLINETNDCNENNICTYNNTITGELIKKEENCLCGYNPDGKKYCLLGSGNKNYTRYITKLKNYYLNNKNCHLAERTDEGCQKDILSNDSYIINKIHELINAKYWAKSNNKLFRAPICAYKVEMPDYDGDIDDDSDIPPIPGEGKCAIYKCDDSSNDEYCAKSNFKNAFNISVSLYDICSDDVFCKIGGEPNDVFYNGTNVKSKCYSNKLIKRYPGESCNLDSECVYPLNNPSSQFHKCEDGRCTGMDYDGICEDNSWCYAGYYCDKFSGKCKEQKQEGDKCTETKECQNNLICLNAKCDSALFSLENGVNVPSYEDIEIQKRFCKSGEVIDNTCVSYNDVEKSLDDEHYLNCSYGTFCKYKLIGLKDKSEINFNCSCGYNSEGIGYCPHFHDYFNSEREEYQKVLKNNYDNECHTENRYDCYKKNNEQKEKELKNKIVNGHLFYNSVTCAKKVLDGNYLYLEKIIFVLGLLFSLF